jgi:hypothetical protein
MEWSIRPGLRALINLFIPGRQRPSILPAVGLELCSHNDPNMIEISPHQVGWDC